MKKIAISMMILWGAFCATAQNTPFFGHYMFNPIYFNPATAANETNAFVAFQHRSQWLGYATSFDGSGGSPSTQMLTALVPIKNFPISYVGLNVINDNLGPLTNMHFGLPFASKVALSSGSIAIGVTPMISSQSVNSDLYRPNHPVDGAIPVGGTQTQFAFNMNAGLYYQNNSGFFLGVSVQNILEPGLDFGLDSLGNKLSMSYALNSGCKLVLSEAFSLSPTVLIRSDLNTYTFDLGAIATIGDRVWTGISYRRQESAILYLGYSLLENKELKVGYSFDYVFENSEAKATTTHEIFIRYDLPDLIFGGKKRIKTPRFSF